MREIIEERPISIPEVKEILDRLQINESFDEEEFDEESLELLDFENPRSFYIRSTIDYVNTFAKVSAEVARKMIKGLVEEQGIPLKKAIQIVNINPDTVEELALIFEKGSPRLNEKELEELLFKIREYREI